MLEYGLIVVLVAVSVVVGLTVFGVQVLGLWNQVVEMF